MENLLSKKKPCKPLKASGWTKLSSSMIKSLYGAKKWQRMACSGAVLFLLLLGGCGIIKPVPVESNTEVHIKDSTVYHVIDSIRITEATRYKDMAWLGDTLKIEGSRSRMWAYADTTREAVLGGLEEDEVEERFKIIYKTNWKIKDSIKVVEKPVPYEVVKEVRYVPKFYKFCLWWFIGSVICIAIYIFLKTKKHISI